MRRVLLLCGVFVAACSADSCGCDGFEQRAFPSGKVGVTIPSVGQARVTASGLAYVESQVPYLISQALPGGLSFCIPRDTSGNPDICVDSTCANGQAGCQVDLTLADQSITPVPSDTLEVSVTIGDVNERLNFDYDATLFTANCYVQVFKRGASEETPATVGGEIPIRLFVDQASDFKEVGIDVGDIVLDLEDVDFKIHGRGNLGDTVTCEGASLVRSFFRGRIEDEIRNALADAVDDLKRSQLCRHCGTGLATCPNGATCSSDGVCDYSPDQCVPGTLGVEGRLDLGGFLGDFVREPNARIDALAKAADLARVDTGASVGLRAGFEPVTVSDCVPVDPTGRPPIRTIPPSRSVTGDTRPGGGAFMLGIGLHKSAVEQALWSAWSSGATCLEVDDEDVMILTTTAFALVAPSMKALAGNAKSAVLSVVANEFPTVELGANTIRPEGDSYVIDDPLLRVLWNDVDFHVFTYAQDRYIRMFTVRLDLDLPVAAVPDGAGGLILVLPGLEDAIAEIEPRRLELLTESPSKVRDVVPTLLSIAAPQIAGALPESVELPQFLGFRLALAEGDITSVDNGEFIAAFADLERTNQAYRAVANTLIIDEEVSYANVLESGFVRPEVRLRVRGYADDPLVDDGDYEFSWRVDGGLWSLFHRDDELVIDDAALAVNGEHTIEVRARLTGEPGTADPLPAQTVVKIDWEPMVEAPAEPEEVEEPKPTPEERPEPVEVETPTPDRGVSTGCSSIAADRRWAPMILFLMVLGLRRRRRQPARRRVMLVAVLSFIAGGCGGCQGELRTNAAERCFGAGCDVDQACTVDSDCNGICPTGNGGICESDRCMCVKACDSGCAESSFCCTATSECVAFGDVCGDRACEPGYEPGVGAATPNRESCELEDVTCTCVPLPPIDTGWHGEHTSIDSDGRSTFVATYNRAYGDLMIGAVQADATIAWHWIDGVPADGTVEGDPDGPRGGVTEPGPDVGTHTSIAIDEGGTAHVFYRDEDADVLKWGKATFAGARPTFESAVLDQTPGAGMWTTAVATGPTIHVVYAVLETSEGNSEVRHVVLDSTAAPASQTPTVIASEPAVERGRNYPPVAGAFLDLTETDGTPFLVYWNGITGRVARTQFDGAAWADPNFLAANTGPWASGALDDQGREHVVFQQRSGFRYSRFGDTTTSRVHDGIHDLDDEYWTGTAGEDSSLRIDGNDLVVAYQDAFDRSLMIAESSSGEEWGTESRAIDGAGTGFWIAMTRRGDRFVADMVVDRDADPAAWVRIAPY